MKYYKTQKTEYQKRAIQATTDEEYRKEYYNTVMKKKNQMKKDQKLLYTCRNLLMEAAEKYPDEIADGKFDLDIFKIFFMEE